MSAPHDAICGVPATSSSPSSSYPLLSVDDAVACVLEQTVRLPPTGVSLNEALGCVLAEDVTAPEPLPPFRASIKVNHISFCTFLLNSYTRLHVRLILHADIILLLIIRNAVRKTVRCCGHLFVLIPGRATLISFSQACSVIDEDSLDHHSTLGSTRDPSA